MKIIQFAGGGDIGGAKTHILSLAKRLSEEQQIVLVSFRKGEFAEDARALGLDVRDMQHGPNIFADLREALRIVDAEKPDLIHCHGAKANIIGGMVKRLRGIPLLTTVHSDPRMDYLSSPLKQISIGNMNLQALKRMDGYVAVSDTTRDSLIAHGTDPQKIYTIFNGLDFSGAPEEGRSPSETGDIVVGVAARLTAVKDLSTTIRAFQIALQKEPRLLLRIAGVGEDEEKLRRLARDLGVEKRVEFVGWISDIRGFYSGVDINVLSSLSEGFPYSLLEGAYQHCAAIATAVGGIPALIQDGVDGYLFQPGDVARFSEYLLRLAGDSALRCRMAESLFQKARREYSLDRMAELQQQVYESLLRRKRMRGRQGAVICGAYGRGNAGDEAILEAILLQMRSLDPDMPLWVMSRKRRETRLVHHVNSFYIFNVFSFLRHLKRAKLFINGGGSLIQDVTSSRSLYFYLFTLRMAKRCGCRVIMYGCGIGPILSESNRRRSAKTLNETAEVITLRDKESVAELARMGVDRPLIALAADPTVNLEPLRGELVSRAFAADGIPAEGKKIGFCIRSWPGFDRPELLAAAADYAYERYGLTPVFLPAEIPKDIAAAEKVLPFVKAPCYAGTRRHSAEELMGMLGSMEVVVAMRLHALVFATMGGAPVVGISYDVKVSSFLSSIGSDSSIDLDELTLERLCAEIDRALGSGRRARAAEAAAGLRRMEGRNGEEAARLLFACEA